MRKRASPEGARHGPLHAAGTEQAASSSTSSSCVVAIFVALWLPLKLGLAGAAKAIDKIESPTWETLGQNADAWRRIWEKLGYTPETAHDIIQNRFHYIIDWPTLIIMAVVLIGYFVFLFRASDKEYREVIAEKFGDKQRIGGDTPCGSHSPIWPGRISAALVLWMLFDWFKTDTTYTEERADLLA